MNTPQAILIGAALIVGTIIVTRPQTSVDAQTGVVGRHLLVLGPVQDTPRMWRIDTMTGAVAVCAVNPQGAGACSPPFQQM